MSDKFKMPNLSHIGHKKDKSQVEQGVKGDLCMNYQKDTKGPYHYIDSASNCLNLDFSSSNKLRKVENLSRSSE
jgi:hypothetical protein